MKKFLILFFTIFNSLIICAQINTDRVMLVGRNALYFEDYLLAIQYFNQVIKVKPDLAEPYFYRAVAKSYLDDFKGAEDDCTKCIDRNPFYTNAYQLRADARQGQKNYDGAIDDYTISLKNNPNDKLILINLGISNIGKKNYDEAEKQLNRLLELYPNYTYGLLTRGSLYLDKKDTLKAFTDYQKAVELDKYFSPAYSMRASLYFAQKDYDKSIADLDQAIKLDPLFSGNFINRGLAKYYKNDFRGSMADYDHVLELDPNSIIAHFNRALLRAQVGDDNKAISDFDFVIKSEPENYIAYMNRGLLKNNIGNFRGALADINKVLKEYPDFYQGFYFRSEIKRKQNDLKGAEQDYIRARKIEDQTRRDVFSGKTKKSDGKTREKSDETIDKFNLLVVADKEDTEKDKYNSDTRGKVQNKQVNIDSEPLFVISYYEKQNDLQKFIHYNKDVDNLNKNSLLSQKLIVSNQEMPLDSTQVGIHFASIDQYSILIGQHPENAIYYFARGIDYMLVQDFATAIDDFTRAVSIDPEFALAYFNLAVASTKQLISKQTLPELYDQPTQQSEFNVSMTFGNNQNSQPVSSSLDKIDDKAIKFKADYESIYNYYTRVLDLSPDFAEAYYNRAETKSMQNDFRAAILDYNQAIKLNSEFAEAYYNRGLNKLRIKDTDRGLEDLRKAGELGIANAYSIIKRMTE